MVAYMHFDACDRLWITDGLTLKVVQEHTAGPLHEHDVVAEREDGDYIVLEHLALGNRSTYAAGIQYGEVGPDTEDAFGAFQHGISGEIGQRGIGTPGRHSTLGETHHLLEVGHSRLGGDHGRGHTRDGALSVNASVRGVIGPALHPAESLFHIVGPRSGTSSPAAVHFDGLPRELLRPHRKGEQQHREKDNCSFHFASISISVSTTSRDP